MIEAQCDEFPITPISLSDFSKKIGLLKQSLGLTYSSLCTDYHQSDKLRIFSPI